MKVNPYIPHSERSRQFWQKASDLLGVHPVIARAIRLEYLGMEADSWLEYMQEKGLEEEDRINPYSDEELALKEEEHNEFQLDQDFCDLLHYRQKQVIELGDEIVCDETKQYCSSKKEYLTRGKRYKILSLSDYGLVGFIATTETNIKNQTNCESHLGIKSIWRNGVEIWNWNLAYLALFVEQNPNHPDTQELEEHCKAEAEYNRTGAEKPCKYTIERHKKDMEDPIYREGFNSDESAENPYPFNSELSDARSHIAFKRYRSAEDTAEMERLSTLIEDSEWSRWSRGYHSKKYSYLSKLPLDNH